MSHPAEVNLFNYKQRVNKQRDKAMGIRMGLFSLYRMYTLFGCFQNNTLIRRASAKLIGKKPFAKKKGSVPKDPTNPSYSWLLVPTMNEKTA